MPTSSPATSCVLCQAEGFDEDCAQCWRERYERPLREKARRPYRSMVRGAQGDCEGKAVEEKKEEVRQVVVVKYVKDEAVGSDEALNLTPKKQVARSISELIQTEASTCAPDMTPFTVNGPPQECSNNSKSVKLFASIPQKEKLDKKWNQPLRPFEVVMYRSNKDSQDNKNTMNDLPINVEVHESPLKPKKKRRASSARKIVSSAKKVKKSTRACQKGRCFCNYKYCSLKQDGTVDLLSRLLSKNTRAAVRGRSTEKHTIRKSASTIDVTKTIEKLKSQKSAIEQQLLWLHKQRLAQSKNYESEDLLGYMRDTATFAAKSIQD
uniref:Uncharacterized protein n=1 Tax=Euplotes harpa TaxID=151035 RepID=A0A7S3NDL1_9SPIT|mmetsp:Transcript_34554/g.40003  ORF Transcript_34554/g.40003 Transcript_34554/m.40003 type:complete len:323 (+) Transcript_34554:121-1089(+)